MYTFTFETYISAQIGLSANCVAFHKHNGELADAARNNVCAS